ncbi:MAG: hypothetical protein ACOX83_07865 [Candidatus Spyradocola sp.]
MRTVAFFGHRVVSDPEQAAAWLERVVAALYGRGARQFFLGGYGAFDALAARAVLAERGRHPDVSAVLVKPYLLGGPAPFPGMETLYPPLEGVPPRYAIARRNQWMVENADVVVVYVQRGFGGAAAALRFARQRRKEILSFFPKND